MPASSPWKVLRDEDALMIEAATRIVAACAQAIALHGRFAWALAGGSTPRKLYALLASPAWRERIDWSHVDFFFGDERCVPPDHADSNYRMARESMLDPLGIEPGRVRRMHGEAEPEVGARLYEAVLQAYFQGPARFDLILLGMGADGHTASLFPGTPALEERARLVVPNRASAGTAERLTLTFPVLNASHQVLFLVSGASKAERLQEVLGGGPITVPAQHVRPDPGSVLWLLDAAAASRLPSDRSTP